LPDGTKDQEYDPGNFLVAPIMGVSYYSERGLWNKGPDTDGPNVIQDDLAVLSNSNNGFGYRVDDYGPNLFGAQPISTTTGSNFSYNGVIERTGDVDAFSFSSNSGTLSLSVDVAPFGAMLDASVKVFDAFGTLMGQMATGSLDETLSITGLAAGTYVIQVSGSGGYGDLGQYTLHGNLPGGGIPPQTDHLLIQGTDLADNINITLVEGTYHVDVNGDVQVVDPNTIKQFDILAGDGDDVVTIGPGVAHAYVLAGGGNDTITGSEFADTITGSSGSDIIYGMDGDDRLAGSGGHDILVGMNGRDRLYGDDGNDQLKGGGGVDRLYGGEGHDILVGESSADKMYGEVGNDTLVGGNGTDLLNGGEGLDYMYGGNDDDYFYSRDLNFDLLSGGPGNDSAESETQDVRDTIENLIT
jgi:Ca2+-binding RTX toxin-like protein